MGKSNKLPLRLKFSNNLVFFSLFSSIAFADATSLSEYTSLTKVNVGGFIKLDTILSRYSAGKHSSADIGEDLLVPATIPVGGNKSDYLFHMHGKTSRLFIKTNTLLNKGSIDAHVEFDSIGSIQGDEKISNSYANRLRHAYVDWHINNKHSLIAGQTWTTFLYVDSMPEKLDLVGPVATILNRQALIRYSYTMNENQHIMVGIENPSTTLNYAEKQLFDDNRYPDFIIRYEKSTASVSYSLGLMWRELRYEDDFLHDKPIEDESYGYGVSLSTRYNFDGGDIRFMFNSGDALGRYMGLNSYKDGSIAEDGNIELSKQQGGFIALRYFWSESWRSNVIYSLSKADNPSWIEDTVAKSYESLHLNLLYSPLKNLTFGSEYIYALKKVENQRRLFEKDNGNLSRLQFSVKYTF